MRIDREMFLIIYDLIFSYNVTLVLSPTEMKRLVQAGIAWENQDPWQ